MQREILNILKDSLFMISAGLVIGLLLGLLIFALDVLAEFVDGVRNWLHRRRAITQHQAPMAWRDRK